MYSHFRRIVVTILPVLLVSACGSDEAEIQPASQESLAEPGPYAVATRDFTFVDSSRATPANGTYAGAPERTLPSRVWYPSAATGEGQGVEGVVPVADGGPFPVIGYAHGFISSLAEGDVLKRHLASHGYIVIAPLFPLSNGGAPGGPTLADLGDQPRDLDFVVDSVAALSGTDSDLAAALDLDRYGVAGLSLGGATVLIAAYHPVLNLPRVKAAAAFAPVACFFAPDFYSRSIPMMILNGSADEVVPFSINAARVLAYAPPPLTVARLLGATHVGFLGIDIAGVYNSDERVACPAVKGADPTRGADVLAAALTADTTGDVVDVNGCGDAICPESFEQTMRGARQAELQEIATLAHFEAELRGRADAAAYRDAALARLNSDVEVTVRH